MNQRVPVRSIDTAAVGALPSYPERQTPAKACPAVAVDGAVRRFDMAREFAACGKMPFSALDRDPMALDTHFDERSWERIPRDWSAWGEGGLDRCLVVVDGGG